MLWCDNNLGIFIVGDWIDSFKNNGALRNFALTIFLHINKDGSVEIGYRFPNFILIGPTFMFENISFPPIMWGLYCNIPSHKKRIALQSTVVETVTWNLFRSVSIITKLSF